MKILKLRIGRLTLGCAIALCLTSKLQAQTNLQFTGISATDEGNMQLTWASQPGGIYEIDEADSLIDTNTGTITWNTLYQDYPSQGTNTFWLDTGNYFADTTILNPAQSPMRFYRVVLTGTNTTTDVPAVSILSPSTNSTITNGDITVTVFASSDQYFLSTKLYVDGQEMNEADTTTNWTDVTGVTNYVEDTYIINSSEWPNGSHTLFATCSCQSGASGAHNAPTIGIGYGVSPFVPVNFDNLITRISFSQPFFAPEDGTTQQVSAVFTANVNWTLEIQDVNSNDVLTATSSGGTLSYAWDGTGTGGTNLPVGTYTYLITAVTNGLALPAVVEGGGDGGGAGSPPSPDFSLSDSSELWAMSADDSDAVPLAIYPPGFDTNSLTIFSATPSQVNAARASFSHTSFTSDDSGGASADYSGASSQSSRAPTRPPINPVKGRAGVYGYAYDTYSANGPYFQLAPPSNGILSQQVNLEGNTTVATSTFNYDPLPEYKRESANFVQAMKKGNWSQGFAKADNQWSIGNLEGSGSIFNGVKVGLVLLHGTWGSAPDYTSGAGGCKQMYFPITSGHSAQYIRMSQMSLGNTATNGLKWMAIAACNSLYHSDWNNMQSMGCYPYNSGLHLLLGTGTVVYTDDHIMELWAKYMTKGSSGTPMAVRDAWINAAHDAYHNSHFPYANTMIFAVAGDSACMGDTLSTYSTPGGSWSYYSQQVWP